MRRFIFLRPSSVLDRHGAFHSAVGHQRCWSATTASSSEGGGGVDPKSWSPATKAVFGIAIALAAVSELTVYKTYLFPKKDEGK